MSERPLHPLAEDYLVRLRHAGRRLPADRMHELVAEIGDHLSESIPLAASDEEAFEALERLGPPGDIVEAEQPAGPPATDRRGLREWSAVFLLPLGGFVFGIGWLIGLVLLWSSRLWTLRDKLLGTLIAPGGLATGLLVLLGATSLRTERCKAFATPINSATAASIGHGGMRCTTIEGLSTTRTVLQIALAVILIAGSIITAVYLARRARNRLPAPASATP
ncbi:MAG: hypothetical protein WAK93_14675 [Solirubrobacteraceae bacterium]